MADTLSQVTRTDKKDTPKNNVMLSYKSIHLDSTASSACTVLLLHAFPLSSEMWTSQLSALETGGIPAIAPDVFGVEGSSQKKSWNFRDYIEEISSLLSMLHIERVTVVGLSMGGYQAFELWQMFPEKVSSMVLCDTRAEQDNEDALANRRDFIAAVRTHGPDEAVSRMLSNVFSPETYTKKQDVVDLFKRIVTKQSGDTIAATMQAIASRADSVESLATITCPVTFIAGKDDKLTPPSVVASMHRQIPGSTLHLIPEAGHFPNMEQPDRFNAHLLEHLRLIGSGA